jgi:hypothetical protein
MLIFSVAPTNKNRDKGKAKAEDKPTSKTPHNAPASSKNPPQTHTEEARRRKKEEKEELNRVLALIEADKRRRKQERQQTQNKEQIEGSVEQTHSPSEKLALSRQMPKGTGKSIRLQVRLPDGRNLRSTFPPNATIASDVRPWIDEEQSKDGTQYPPYNFKQILTPQSNRNIDVSEEATALESLDFYPSATLVLVPVSDYANAYSGGGSTVVSVAQNGLAGLYNVASSIVGTAAGIAGSLVGFGQRGSQPTNGHVEQVQSEHEQQQEQSTRPPGAQIRVRTLADQRAEAQRDPTQLYNGNQLNFESRDEDNT